MVENISKIKLKSKSKNRSCKNVEIKKRQNNPM